MQKNLVVRGAREHNLKNISVEIPRDQLVVITGLSGSGKSSLAFDTIYAEGQRRYVESLSAYARQFLGQMDKPDVDQIEGLSPAISIDQKGASHNPRSTVGTVTEIYDYMRLLFARIGTPHCPACGREVNVQTSQQIIEAIYSKPHGSRIMILAPLVRDRKGEHKAVFEDIRKAGYVRVRVDGRIFELDDDPALEPYQLHTIEAVVDRLIIRHENGAAAAENEDLSRLADSVETALKLGGGTLLVHDVTDPAKPWDKLYSEQFACLHCGTNLPEIEPRTFSFNSPHGACPACDGLGTKAEFDPELVLHLDKPLAGGGIRPWAKHSRMHKDGYYAQLVLTVARHLGCPSICRSASFLPASAILSCTAVARTRRLPWVTKTPTARAATTRPPLRGHSPFAAPPQRQQRPGPVRGFGAVHVHPHLPGLRRPPPAPRSLAVTIGGVGIHQVSAMPVSEALPWFSQLGQSDNGTPPAVELTQRQQLIAAPVLKEITARLKFMNDVGLSYLSLSRAAQTLSGGESQRIRLATQNGSQLMGCLYILDEPSIGLHQRDNLRLIKTLEGLRELGNTVLVVEHDEDTMRAADWLIDMGPGAGKLGGEVVWSAERESFIRESTSLTAKYLRGEKQIAVPPVRRWATGGRLWCGGRGKTT
jgi:excinuclease ABC subunit A